MPVFFVAASPSGAVKTHRKISDNNPLMILYIVKLPVKDTSSIQKRTHFKNEKNVKKLSKGKQLQSIIVPISLKKRSAGNGWIAFCCFHMFWGIAR